tara:strand:- start:1172 stop:1639 length:468 start_codon:yes stop_codon:yes gene_type:complete
MRKYLVLFLFSFYSFIIFADDVTQIRNMYISSIDNEKKCEDFGKHMLSLNYDENNLYQAYLGCYYFIKCKFTSSNLLKFKYFNKGKDLLESSIKNNSNSIELRFLRYSIQVNLPRILFYYQNIEQDLNFIHLHLDLLKEEKLKKYILTSLNNLNK